MSQFDLETAISTWRQFHLNRRAILPNDLDELESHLRSDVARRVRAGLTEEAAFRAAVEEMGDLSGGEAEYRKVYWRKLKQHRQLGGELTWRAVMLKNYLMVAWRNARRQPGYTCINVAGLGVGLACFLLIALYVQEEWRYDRFHENADRIVRVAQAYSDTEGTRRFARSMPAIGPALESDFTEVETTVRLQHFQGPLRRGDQVFNEDQMFFADASVFEVFTFPLLQGDPATALAAPNTLVLTETAARRYFGEADPMGQTLTLSDTLDFTVTGVAQDVPLHSHWQFEVLLSFETWRIVTQARRGVDLNTLWNSGTFYTYALLASPTSGADVAERLPDFLGRYVNNATRGWRTDLELQPLTEIYLQSNLRQEIGATGNLRALYIFSGIALLILLISCINFVNLTTARATQRAREVGVRKVLGAERQQLTGQFLGEALLLSMVAALVSVVLVGMALPWFNGLTGKAFTWAQLWEAQVLLQALAAAVGVGLLAGAYPALVLARFQPMQVLKGIFAPGRRSQATRLRQGLVAVQFALSIGIVACMLVAWQQLGHWQQRPLGFAPEQVVVVPFSWEPTVVERLGTLKQEMLEIPGVRHVTASGDVPGRMFTTMSYWVEGMPAEDRRVINALVVDPDFAETYGLALLAGEDFDNQRTADQATRFLVNETAVAEMGLTPAAAIGKRFRMNGMGEIIGVVADFHFEGLQHELEPLAMVVWPSWFGYVSVQVASDGVPATLGALEAAWQTVVPELPYEYFFLDDDFATQYRAEQQFGQVFASFALLALFLSCLGLFGLAAYLAAQRTKELGVRKVLGASVPSLVLLLTRDVMRLAGLGFLVAAPLAGWAMTQWLAGFAYRIDLSLWPFLGAGGGVLLLALLTVSYQVGKAALADPVRSLRYE